MDSLGRLTLGVRPDYSGNAAERLPGSITMSRHGQCRCGVRLTFRKRHGYKARCPGCGKVVRLQPDGPPTAAGLLEVQDPSNPAQTFEHDPVPVMEEDLEIAEAVDVEPVADELVQDE